MSQQQESPKKHRRFRSWLAARTAPVPLPSRAPSEPPSARSALSSSLMAPAPDWGSALWGGWWGAWR